MTIRPYQPSDKSQLFTLMAEFAEYLESIDPLHRIEYAKGGPEYAIEKLLHETSEKNGLILVAEENDALFGFIGGFVTEQDHDELMENKKATPGTVSEFFITQKLRRSGLGSALLTRMEDHLKEQGCDFIRFEVFAPNSIARDFYRKHGYQDRSVMVSKNL